MDYYTLKEAARRLGYRRVNTVREKHLATEVDRERLGASYDSQGRRLLDAAAVDRLARRVERERKTRGNWRVKNLGTHAQPGRGDHGK